MNIGQLFTKILDAVAKFKAGDKWGAAIIVGEIIQAILSSMPPAMAGVPLPVHGNAFVCEAATDDELIAAIEKCCHEPMNASVSEDAPTGPAIDILKPLLLAWLKRLIGL